MTNTKKEKEKEFKKMSNKSKQKIMTGATLFAGAALSTIAVSAAPNTVYNKDGIILQLEGNKSGVLKLFVENKTDKDMHEVVLKNEDIKGLKVDKAEVKIGTVKSGEKREVEFKYQLAKTVVEEVTNSTTDGKKDSESAESTDGKKDFTPQNTKVQTGDPSDNMMNVWKIVVPVVVAGVAGTLIVLVAKKKKSKQLMSLLLGAGILSSSIFGGAVKVDAAPNNIADSGRFFFNIPIEGTVTLEGEDYNYAGVFYYENDRVETKTETKEEQVVSGAITAEANPDVESGKWEWKDGKEGAHGVDKVTYEYIEVNGKRTGDGKEIARETIKEPVTGVVIFGTKPVEKEIENKTKYVAAKEEPVGVQRDKAGNNPKNGINTLTATGFDLEKMEPEITTDVKEEPVDRIIEVGVHKVVEDETIQFKVRYEANPDAKVGTHNQIKTQGKNGVGVGHYTHDVDPETGKLSEPIFVKHKVKTQPVTQVELVGVQDTIETVIKFKTVEKKDATKWDNYKAVTQKGENGKRIDTVTRPITEEGIVVKDNNKATVVSTKTIEPKDEITTVGTKKPNWKVVVEDKTEQPFETTKKVYVSTSEFANIATKAHVDAKLSEFNSKYADKPTVGNSGKILTKGVKGEVQKTYEQAVDENGKPIPGYETRNHQTKTIREPVNQVEMYFNIAYAGDKTLPARVTYKANESLALGTKNVITAPKGGKQEGVTFYNGPIGSASGDTKWTTTIEPVMGLTEVGALEEKAGEVLKHGRVFNEEAMTDDWDTVETILQAGQDGIRTVKRIYHINPDTGEIGEMKSEISSWTQELKDEIYTTGWAHYTNKFNASYEEELFRLINEYRKQEGVPELTWDESYRSQMRMAASEASIIFEHQGLGERNLGRGADTPKQQFEAWKASEGHRRGMLVTISTKAAIGVYIDMYGDSIVAFGDSD